MSSTEQTAPTLTEAGTEETRTPSHRRAAAFVGALLTLLAVMLAPPPAYADETIIGKLTYIGGTVEITRKGGKNAVAETGESLYIGDTITTAKNSKAEIIFIDRSILKLAAETSIEITEYLLEGQKPKGSTTIKNIRGTLRSVISKSRGTYDVTPFSRDYYNIETATATVGVRGTNFFVAFDEEEESTIVVVTRGVVRSQNPKFPGKIVHVTAGRTTTIAKETPPTHPVVVPDKLLQDLIEATEPKAEETTSSEDSGDDYEDDDEEYDDEEGEETALYDDEDHAEESAIKEGIARHKHLEEREEYQKYLKENAKRKCINCHYDTYKENENYPKSHSGVFKSKCEMCHLTEGTNLEERPESKHLSEDLKVLKRSGTDACQYCHGSSGSHVVGIKAPLTPEGFPTLPGKVITCVTCHTPHGGDNFYMLRTKTMSELCTFCHRHGGDKYKPKNITMPELQP